MQVWMTLIHQCRIRTKPGPVARSVPVEQLVTEGYALPNQTPRSWINCQKKRVSIANWTGWITFQTLWLPSELALVYFVTTKTHKTFFCSFSFLTTWASLYGQLRLIKHFRFISASLGTGRPNRLSWEICIACLAKTILLRLEPGVKTKKIPNE